MSHDVLDFFSFSSVAEAEVDKIISNFRDNAADWDELKPSIIKTVKDSIKTPLAHICNLFFDTGIFPVELKLPKLCLFLSLEMNVYLPVMDQCQYYLYFQQL